MLLLPALTPVPPIPCHRTPVLLLPVLTPVLLLRALTQVTLIAHHQPIQTAIRRAQQHLLRSMIHHIRRVLPPLPMTRIVHTLHRPADLARLRTTRITAAQQRPHPARLSTTLTTLVQAQAAPARPFMTLTTPVQVQAAPAHLSTIRTTLAQQQAQRALLYMIHTIPARQQALLALLFMIHITLHRLAPPALLFMIHTTRLHLPQHPAQAACP